MSIKLCERCAAPATVWFEHWDQPEGRSVWMAACDACYTVLDQPPPIKIRVSLQGGRRRLVNQDSDCA